MLDGGESLRNYLYITDSVELLLNIFSGKELVYNIGGDTEEVSIAQLADKVANNFGSEVVRGKSKINATQAAPRGVSLDMSKSRTEFPSFGKNIVNLDKGIKQIIRWYNLGNEK